MADEKKPTGGAAMDALARKLIQVPKRELKKQIRLYRERRNRRKK